MSEQSTLRQRIRKLVKTLHIMGKVARDVMSVLSVLILLIQLIQLIH